MSGDTAAANAYGGFALGAMQLALPMAALREVRALDALVPLPCPAPAVVGGMALCGVVLPVLDLRRLVGQPADEPSAVVVIVAHQGRVLGLLASAVTGVFTSDAKGLNAAEVDDAVGRVLAGSVRRSDDGQLAAVLSPAALMALPQVPVVDDPEPERAQLADARVGVDTRDAAVPVMLLRCGRLTLAIDAMAVQATLATPQVERSALSFGDCLGVTEHEGARLPAVDLASLCGLGRSAPAYLQQAFVLSLDSGRVALMISEVIDVVRTQPGDVIAVPALALPRAGLFAGTLPSSALPPETVSRAAELGAQYLVLDGRALRQLPELLALASTSGAPAALASAAGPTDGAGGAGTAAAPAGTSADGASAPTRPLITFELGGEVATPLAQVCEILPYSSETAVLSHRPGLLGVVVNRGRAIPVMCLSGLVGLPSPQASPAVSVLVVESAGELLGFAVPQLRAIEQASWEPELPVDAAHRGDALAQAVHARALAQVGEGAGRRMLRVVDLHRVAAALQQEAAAAH